MTVGIINSAIDRADGQLRQGNHNATRSNIRTAKEAADILPEAASLKSLEDGLARIVATALERAEWQLRRGGGHKPTRSNVAFAEEVARMLPSDKAQAALQKGLESLTAAALDRAEWQLRRGGGHRATRNNLELAEEVARKLPADKAEEALQEGLKSVTAAACERAEWWLRQGQHDSTRNNIALAEEVAGKLPTAKIQRTLQSGLTDVFNATCDRAEWWTNRGNSSKAQRNLMLAQEIKRKADSYQPC